MAAATVLQKIYNFFHSPGVEVVSLTCTDGETYTSTKFKTILGAVVSGNEDNDAHINVTYSGSVATINYHGMNDETVTLILFGKK